MKRLRLLTLFSLIVATAIFFLKKSNPTTIAGGEGLIVKKEWLVNTKNPLTPEKDRRAPDQTFLTYPEWFLVFSPEEQATYYNRNTCTSFPYMNHVSQIWESYKIVNDQVKNNFPPNKGYHFMIWVIGSSASVEYSIKAWYETTIGRITDTREVITEEDRFNADFTADYVRFIKDRPWYEYDFKSKLKDLWSTTSFFGDNFFRKLERKYFLTSELMVKYGYGKLIGLGTDAVYEEALPTTAVILQNPLNKQLPYKIEKVFPDSSMLVYLPRYDKFAAAVDSLCEEGVLIKEIAGNTSGILVTILTSEPGPADFKGAQTLFVQPVASNRSLKRVAVVVPVKDVPALLRGLRQEKINVEHIFDY